MSDTKIKIRVVKRCFVGREVAEVGTIVSLEAIDAAGLTASGRGEAIDEGQAKQAFIAATNEALRGEKRNAPREPSPSWVRRVIGN